MYQTKPKRSRIPGFAAENEYVDGAGAIYVVEAFEKMRFGAGLGWCMISAHLNDRSASRTYHNLRTKYEYLRVREIDASIHDNRLLESKNEPRQPDY